MYGDILYYIILHENCPNTRYMASEVFKKKIYYIILHESCPNPQYMASALNEGCASFYKDNILYYIT